MLSRVWGETDRDFDPFFLEPLDSPWARDRKAWIPALDLIDNETQVMVQAEMPGMAAKDIHVSIRGSMLTLSGEKDELKEENGDSFFSISERRFGSFQRTIGLPERSDAEGVTAELSNGVLTVRIPKHSATKPKHVPVKEVEVKVG
jgi:HSP20 family protein